MLITILNTSILTSYGCYLYSPEPLENIKKLLSLNEWQSAIGHVSTAQIISELLDIDCPVNRIMYKQNVGDIAIVFKLLGRPDEGKILSKSEIEKIGYEWGSLGRVS